MFHMFQHKNDGVIRKGYCVKDNVNQRLSALTLRNEEKYKAIFKETTDWTVMDTK